MSKYRVPLPPYNFKSKIQKIDEEFLKTENFKRINNRKNNEIRDMFIKLGEDGYSDASCFYSLGNTKILCLIYGPKPDSKNATYNKGKVFLDIKSLNMNTYGSNEKSDDDIKSLLIECISNIIILDKYPHCSIYIKCLIIQSDGGCLSAALTCISLALIKAQIQMHDMIISINIHSIICPKTNRVYHLVDLDGLEEKYYRSKYEMNEITLGICLNLRTVCFFHGSGNFFNSKTLEEIISYAECACRSLGYEIKKILKNYILKK
ncbi:3'exoribonuclease, putative [Plasmodium gallinaceum]|uniref:3'exoribonuclease, putative n=1 Tax=Plasmodium gallinaceum TaxID=5849 RepID=A0A1J1GWK2_PLAGA|nr:3'exoribonuclease, putative [Plasmodium gallinaceum]CRG95389.1 3'exoribonuclease, putative [Plasmodium gallinaceum]